MGLRLSLRRKAYTKLVLYFVCFVILAVLIASLFQTHLMKNKIGATVHSDKSERAPASVIYDQDNNQIVDMSIDEINRENGVQSGGPLFKPVRRSSDDWGAGKIDAQERTGISAKRARLVVFQPSILHRAKRKDGELRLNLFDDMVLSGRFLPSSGFHLNKGMYTGQISDDPDSLFRLNVDGSAISGTIEAKGREFQIVDAGNGQQYIIELDTKSRH